MLGGIALVASFTATLTSRVTTEAISLLITKPEDLSGKKVATVAGTVAEETLIELRAEVISYASPEAAFRAAEVGAAEAVVFDAPVLAYLIKKNTATPLMLVGPLFDYRDYGIVVAEKEGLLEEINRSLLLMIEKGVTRRLHSKWIGGIE
jgi:polar amino acid transport system substrate-binding protein